MTQQKYEEAAEELNVKDYAAKLGVDVDNNMSTIRSTRNISCM
jgi:hypothetical protein